jgi:predicted aminopeptidase
MGPPFFQNPPKGTPGLLACLPPGAAALLLLAGSAVFSGCYTLSQGTAMLGYLSRAEPLESLLEEGEAPAEEQAENRRFVERVRDIRRFAREELGLRDTPNYTGYVKLDRDYLALVVSAGARDSFSPHLWWFPVAGSVPYKGFFNEAGARREAEKLRKKGLDVWVRRVDAFSTLGWFKDPLYSYMRSYPAHALADLIIHETLHATVYLPGQSGFNEELAEFVGSRGARLYVEKTFGPGSPEYRRIGESEADNAAFLAFINRLIAELDALYRGPLDREEKLRQKETVIRAAQERFAAEYDSLFQSDNYRGFSGLPVNNAYLELFRLYYSGGSYLEGLYLRSGGDLEKFIAAAKTIPRKAKNPRLELEKALGL